MTTGAGRAEDTGSPGTPPFRARRSVAPQPFTAGCRGSSLTPLGWRSFVDEALFVAGFQASNIQSQPSKNKTLRFDQERLARLTENIASLPEEEQEELDIPFSMLEYDIERRVRRVRERKS